jgi:hypothetical protein
MNVTMEYHKENKWELETTVFNALCLYFLLELFNNSRRKTYWFFLKFENTVPWFWQDQCHFCEYEIGTEITIVIVFYRSRGPASHA